jgi:hypothetical protein
MVRQIDVQLFVQILFVLIPSNGVDRTSHGDDAMVNQIRMVRTMQSYGIDHLNGSNNYLIRVCLRAGPMYYKGLYHLFYQYNPKGAVWGNIIWAHSVSTDLIDWVALEPAIYPSKPFDVKGCWSGSATVLPSGMPVIMYTGIDPRERQVQNVAYPANLSDPFLRQWIKPTYNPIIYPDEGINASAFRDPTTAWYGPDG